MQCGRVREGRKEKERLKALEGNAQRPYRCALQRPLAGVKAIIHQKMSGWKVRVIPYTESNLL